MQKKVALPPIHPGEIIKEDILPSVGLSVAAAARALGVSRQMLHDILAAKRPLSAVMCLKVARLFEALRHNTDAAGYKLAQRVLAGDHAAIETGILRAGK